MKNHKRNISTGLNNFPKTIPKKKIVKSLKVDKIRKTKPKIHADLIKLLNFLNTK